MAINPAHIPLKSLDDLVDGHATGSLAPKIQGGQGDFAGMLREALLSGKMDADMLLGREFMGIMAGEVEPAEASGLYEMAGVLEALEMGTGQGARNGLSLFQDDSLLLGLLREKILGAEQGGGADLKNMDQTRPAAQGSGQGPEQSSKPDLSPVPAAGPDKISQGPEASLSETSLSEASLAEPSGALPHAPVQAPESPAATVLARAGKYRTMEPETVAGFLSARFESKGDPGAISHDRVGGTSYGVYQLSSKAGTFDGFLSYLKDKAPEWAERLGGAGPADTGGTNGAMPLEWKKIASENPARFSGLQQDFIRSAYFSPAAKWVAELTGIDVAGRAPALAEVLWSTAVQHGAKGSANIFQRAVQAAGSANSPDFDRTLIQEVYKNRAKQFPSSSSRVREAVRNRLGEEMRSALDLLDGASSLDTSV